MLAPPHGVRVFLCTQATDMRKSFDGLIAATKSVLGENPLSGHLFVFVNRSRNRAKMLLWENGGFWLCSRRLEQGTFAVPALTESHVGTWEIDRVAKSGDGDRAIRSKLTDRLPRHSRSA